MPDLFQRVRYFLSRATKKSKIQNFFLERLSEPLHLNFLSLFVLLFGSFRSKVYFDLVIRQQNAFPILYAVDLAKWRGYSSIVVCEFGVAAGAGMMNMCAIADRVAKATGIEICVVGFDNGVGMPDPLDYRDLPEFFTKGDFPMDEERLRRNLPPNA